MELNLIELCEGVLRHDPTGQKKKLLLAELGGAKLAYIRAADRLSAQVKSLEASARELDVFIKILEGEKDGIQSKDR